MPAMPNPTDYRLDFLFAVQPVTSDAPAPASDAVRFTGVAYSGGIIPSYGFAGDVAIDLDSLQNPDAQNIPVLIDHRATIENIAGKGNLARIGQALHITGSITSATEAGQQISALLAESYPLQLSVGLQATFRETTGEALVNGQQLAVKGIFENARIVEVSFVTTGADPYTSAAQFSAKPIEPAPPPVSQPANFKGVVMTRSPEDQALIDDLQKQIKDSAKQIKASADQITELQSCIAADAVKQRKAALSALFTELGRDAPQDTSAYEAMTDHTFAAYCTDLRAMKPAPKDRALFNSQSANMAARAAVPDAKDKATTLMSAVTQLNSRRTQHPAA
jgi:hypothetical protein